MEKVWKKRIAKQITIIAWVALDCDREKNKEKKQRNKIER